MTYKAKLKLIANMISDWLEFGDGDGAKATAILDMINTVIAFDENKEEDEK